ncbi:hypothetical protein [Vannielia litorea]|nr:hypothetical protein [Vannielia litorea]
MALFVAALASGQLIAPLFDPTLGFALHRAAGLSEPLLFALLLLGALCGLHGAPHRGTWVGLSALAVTGVALGFLGYLLPWGQVSFALASGPAASLPALAPALLPLALLAVLLRHLGQYWHLRHPSALALIPAVALLAALALPLPPPAAPDAFASTADILADVRRTPLPANPLATPVHILPETWLLPFYAILRAPPDKTAGILAFFAALALWVALPWLDRHASRPLWERPASALVAALAALCLLALLPLGAVPASPLVQSASLALTAAYFTALLVGLPLAARRLPRPHATG